MLSSRVFWRLFAAFVALVLVTTASAMLLVERQVERDERASLERELELRLALLQELARPVLERREFESLRARLPALGKDSGARLTVIDATGVVVADSDEDPARMDSHLDRPEIQQALQGGEGRALRYSRTLGTTLIYRARSVRSGTDVVGFVRASQPLSAMETRLAHVRGLVLAGGGVGALLGLVAAWWIAQHVTGRISAMIDFAGAVARGEGSKHLAPAGSDELGELGRSLNGMSRELAARMDTIVTDRNKFVAILASMVEGVVAVDRLDRVVHMNEVAGRLLRASPAESVGRRIWEVTRVIEVAEILERARQASGELEGEVRQVHAGRETVLELRATPLVDGSGAVAGAVVVLHDVTELRRLENLRRDFVANVSHELKTPLTAIRAVIETLIEDRAMDAATRERFHRKIQDQTGRLTSLVNDLLTLGRVEAEGQSRERRALDLCAVVRECASSIGPAALKQGLVLDVSLEAGPLLVEADEESLRQIVDNLLDNACKYTPSGGRIDVRVRARSRERAPNATDGEEASLIELEVADTGIGIEPRDLERIFERFYRADKARSRELGGTGLGLSIVKHLVLALGGHVSVESQVGRGSTFRVLLPRRHE